MPMFVISVPRKGKVQDLSQRVFLTRQGVTEWNSEFRKRLAMVELQGGIKKKPKIETPKDPAEQQARLIQERNQLLADRQKQRENQAALRAQQEAKNRELQKKKQREEIERFVLSSEFFSDRTVDAKEKQPDELKNWPKGKRERPQMS